MSEDRKAISGLYAVTPELALAGGADGMAAPAQFLEQRPRAALLRIEGIRARDPDRAEQQRQAERLEPACGFDRGHRTLATFREVQDYTCRHRAP